MSLSLVLDTDIVIDIQRLHPPALAWYSTLSTGNVGLPGFVALELIQSARNKSEAVSASNIIKPFPIIWPNAVYHDWALNNFAQLHLSHNVGLLDMLIAATAMTQSVPLATFNTKHFNVIPRLSTVQPYPK